MAKRAEGNDIDAQEPSRPESSERDGIVILVDADACPVKDEVYRVAERHGLPVAIVANAPILVPRAAWIIRILVAEGPDVADDWIAARARHGAIVVTADIPLAARCVKAGASVISSTGKAFTEASIGGTLATRNLMDSLRSAGEITGGPPPFSPRNRSAFLSALDVAIQRLKRSGMGPGHIDKDDIGMSRHSDPAPQSLPLK